jgi:hypothetical protein
MTLRFAHARCRARPSSTDGIRMKLLALLVTLLAAGVLLAGNTAACLLSVLDVHCDVDVTSLMVGELRPLFRSDAFAAAFPHLEVGEQLVAVGPLLMMFGVGIGLVLVRRRWRVPAAAMGMAALFAGALPYAVGALALRGNTVPEATGPWLVWMLLGPMYGAVLAVLFAAHSLFARKAKVVESAPAKGSSAVIGVRTAQA